MLSDGSSSAGRDGWAAAVLLRVGEGLTSTSRITDGIASLWDVFSRLDRQRESPFGATCPAISFPATSTNGAASCGPNASRGLKV